MHWRASMSPRSSMRTAPQAPSDTPAVFPDIDLPVKPPFPPMEAIAATELPEGSGWLYEPKWDGFRCLVFRRGSEVLLQSKAGQPLGRYFPEMLEAFRALPVPRFVLDGELVIVDHGHLAFDALLQRIHPAESRIRTLASATPALYLAFDLLVDERGRDLRADALFVRREHLERIFEGVSQPSVRLSPSVDRQAVAQGWLRDLGSAGLDGVMAKRGDLSYRSGTRDGMVKVKRLRTADCIVAGYRRSQTGGSIGSLLLGLTNDEGRVDHVGFAASFTARERAALHEVLAPLEGGSGFTGRAPGGPSRWSAGRNTEWVPLDPRLVCEVRYDHYADGRFRHGTKFLRWRPDKAPAQCTFDQVEPRRQRSVLRQLGL